MHSLIEMMMYGTGEEESKSGSIISSEVLSSDTRLDYQSQFKNKAVLLLENF